MSQPLTAADYSDWLKYAGLYIANISHADRYRTFADKISRAGVVVKIVHDLLQDNPGGLDLQAWRNSNVYEFGADAAFRIEQTALALEAIGAPRAADKARSLRNTSMLGGIQEAMLGGSISPGDVIEKVKGPGGVAKLIEEFRANVARAMPGLAQRAEMPTPQPKPVPPDAQIESKEKIEHLVAEYVERHETKLRGDMLEFGDVRAEPGFDPEKRMEELDRQRRQAADRELQKDLVPKMAALMEDIEAQLAKNPKRTPGKIAPARRELMQYYRKYADRPSAELVPEMQRCLKDADRFQKKYEHIFRPPAIDDDALLKRLADIGSYEVDLDGKHMVVTWHTPAGLTCDWTEFLLSIHYRPGNAMECAALLDGVDRLRKHFAEYQGELRHEVLDHFSNYRDMYARTGYDEFECGPDGLPTEASILAEAGGGGIHMRIDDEGDVHIEVFFHVAWDDEHGLELFIEDEPEEAPVDPTALPDIDWHDSGPAVTTETLAEFEKEHHITLPAEYRAFLLKKNGGSRAGSAFTITFDWGSTPVYLEMLYPMESPQGPKVADGLGEAYLIHCAEDRPAHLLPIGRIRVKDPGARVIRVDLLLGLSGKNAGKVLANSDVAMLDQFPMEASVANAMMTEMFEKRCANVAPSFAAFLKKLTSS